MENSLWLIQVDPLAISIIGAIVTAVVLLLVTKK